MIYNFILGQPFAIKMQSRTNALPTASKHFDNIHSFTLVMWVKFTSLTERQVILQVAREEKNNAGNTCTFSRFLLDGGELKCDGDWFDDAKFPVIIIYAVFYKKKKIKRPCSFKFGLPISASKEYQNFGKSEHCQIKISIKKNNLFSI